MQLYQGQIQGGLWVTGVSIPKVVQLYRKANKPYTIEQISFNSKSGAIISPFARQVALKVDRFQFQKWCNYIFDN